MNMYVGIIISIYVMLSGSIILGLLFKLNDKQEEINKLLDRQNSLEIKLSETELDKQEYLNLFGIASDYIDSKKLGLDWTNYLNWHYVFQKKENHKKM